MEYVWIGLATFVAFATALALHETWIAYIDLRRIKKRQQLFKKINDIMIEDYANVDRVDEVTKEWQSE